MQTRRFLFLPLLILPLAACGSEPAAEPTEQIVVREPGEDAGSDTSASADDAGDSDDASQLAALGKSAFGTCAACHSVEADRGNLVGPNLHGVIDRKAGSVADFSYSPAMKSSDIVWTVAELDDYLANPTAKVPGTTMVAGAIGNPDTRKALIAYLEDVSTN